MGSQNLNGMGSSASAAKDSKHSLSFLSLTFSDAAFTWLHFNDSVTFIQGQTATMYWFVEVDIKPWFDAGIYRNRVKSTGTYLIAKLNGRPTEMFYLKRAADMAFQVQGQSAFARATFTLGNLSRDTDEMYYEFIIKNYHDDKESKFTKLNVLGEYCIFW